MTRQSASRSFFKHCIEHKVIIKLAGDGDAPCYVAEYKADNAPDRRVESTITFNKHEILLAVYYSQTGDRIVRESENINELLKVLNFLNNSVLYVYDGYALFSPGFVVSDNGEIILTTVIPYDFYGLFREATDFYITAFCPQLLNAVAVDVFLTLFGEISSNEAIKRLKRVLSEG